MVHFKPLSLCAVSMVLALPASAQPPQAVISCSIVEELTCGNFEGEFNYCDAPCDGPSGFPGDPGPIVLVPICPPFARIESVNSDAIVSGLRPAFSDQVGHEVFTATDVVCVKTRSCNGCVQTETIIGGSPIVNFWCKPPEEDAAWTPLRTYQKLTPDGDGDGPPASPPLPPPPGSGGGEPGEPTYPQIPIIG